MLNLKECRQILGPKSNAFTNDEILQLRDALYTLAEIDYVILKERWKTKNAIIYYYKPTSESDQSILNHFQEFLRINRINLVKAFSKLKTGNDAESKSDFDKILEFLNINSQEIDCFILLDYHQLNLSPTEIQLLIDYTNRLDISLLAADQFKEGGLSSDELLVRFQLDSIVVFD